MTTYAPTRLPSSTSTLIVMGSPTIPGIADIGSLDVMPGAGPVVQDELEPASLRPVRLDGRDPHAGREVAHREEPDVGPEPEVLLCTRKNERAAHRNALSVGVHEELHSGGTRDAAVVVDPAADQKRRGGRVAGGAIGDPEQSESVNLLRSTPAGA